MHPVARRTGISTQELNGELLVYDRDSDIAHCLSAVAADVWTACDGNTAPEDMVDASRSLSDVQAALAQLDELNLLQSGTLSRRQVVARAAGLAAAPLVLSVVAPTAAQAVTGGGAGTTVVGQACGKAGDPPCGNTAGGQPTQCCTKGPDNNTCQLTTTAGCV